MDPQKILGLLLSGGTGRRRLPSQAKVAVGMGAVGLAIAAWEHFSQQQKTAGSAAPPRPPGVPHPIPAPPPVPAGATMTPPPRTPGAGPPPFPSPPPPNAPVGVNETPEQRANREGALLVRAMAVAAWADGEVDAAERAAVADRLATSGLPEEDRSLFLRDLETPPRLDDILSQVDTPQLAEQLYLVSLLATRADTTAERDYLRHLSARLGLDPTATQRLHMLAGIRI